MPTATPAPVYDTAKSIYTAMKTSLNLLDDALDNKHDMNSYFTWNHATVNRYRYELCGNHAENKFRDLNTPLLMGDSNLTTLVRSLTRSVHNAENARSWCDMFDRYEDIDKYNQFITHARSVIENAERVMAAAGAVEGRELVLDDVLVWKNF